MTFRCARCDHRAEDDEAAAEHARETGHWRCGVCRRESLREHEQQTCPKCIARVRADLADILSDYTLLDEPKGVNVLTLLGHGTMQRRGPDETFHRYELDQGVRDEWTGDPLPVLPALVSWEDFVREHYGKPKGPPDPCLTDVVGWFTRNLDSRLDLAQTFPAFDELAGEIHRHRSAVRHAAGLADDPLEAPAHCFDCGGQLLRTYGDEGLTDDWTCESCRGVYDQQSYFLALRAHATAAPGEWRAPIVAAWLVDRPFRTVQTWMRELTIRSACLVGSRRQVVWMPDVKELSDTTERRRRAS